MIHTMKLIKQFYVSPEHLEKCSCEVLTCDHRYIIYSYLAAEKVPEKLVCKTKSTVIK